MSKTYTEAAAAEKEDRNRAEAEGVASGVCRDWNRMVICTRERLWDKWKEIQASIKWWTNEIFEEIGAKCGELVSGSENRAHATNIHSKN